ncbi:MAG: oligosaccharide flippase family protein, partial [Bacteroidota bacterium]
MNPLKKLFKQTAIYGLATVLPRMLNFLLLPLYTSVLITAGYGELSIVFAWIIIFNVVLAYGMETAFFRFYNKVENKETVVSTSLLSILASTVLFVILASFSQSGMANFSGVAPQYVKYATWILALDALAIIPFAWLRATERPLRYAVIKIGNVLVNLGLNIFFLLYLPKMAQQYPEGFASGVYRPNFELGYIFFSNLVASGLTLGALLPLYLKTSYTFDWTLWKQMLNYAWPILVAGLAFSINEAFDRILLERLLPEDVAASEIGKYAACYKLGMFMMLFATAFRLGIEPFFFSHAGTEHPERAYAQITNYFVILGSVILLSVVVFSDVLKVLFIDNDTYWEAMDIVPLILLASFFLGIYHNLSVWYKVTDRTRFGAYISLIGALLTIILNIGLIPSLGYVASAIATLVAYGSMM